MGRPEAAAIQAREREVVGELVALLADRAPDVLEPAYAEMWRRPVTTRPGCGSWSTRWPG